MGCPIRRSAMRIASRWIFSCFVNTGLVLRSISRRISRRSDPTRARTVSRPRMHHLPSIDETYEQVLREQEPNYLRLYLNPHVAQACFCLDRYMTTTWTERPAPTRRRHAHPEDCQSFLANGF